VRLADAEKKRNGEMPMKLAVFAQRPLPPEAEERLLSQHESELEELLPVLGPLFGIGVILFFSWDYLIDPRHAMLTLAVRVAFVLPGMAAYISTRLPWTPTQRCGYLYWIHASAIIVCEFLLKSGFMYGLAGVTACLFTLSVVTLRGRDFLWMLSLPSVLFVVLAAIRLPTAEFINALALYIFCACLAYILMRVVRFFRQKAFLLQEEVMELSRHDSLTGVYRRGYLIELAEREISVARRSHRPLALVMLDLDHFKRVNDTYGHAIGDRVIQHFARSCMETLRDVDHFGRIGGEEFVCVLPDSSEQDAMACAERLRRNVEALSVDTPQGPLRFTVSIGVSLFDAGMHAGWKDLLKDADDALYRAKREGRNRVVLSG
jgi:diguanylate cyclase (GGDEF)-like protein